MQDQRQQFLSYLRRDIGSNQIEAQRSINVIKAIAEHGPGIIDPVLFDIFLAVFNGDEILVHQQGLTLRGEPGEGDADRPVPSSISRGENRPQVLLKLRFWPARLASKRMSSLR